MLTVKKLLAFFIFLVNLNIAHGQLVADPTFIVGTGPNNFVKKSLLQTDGKIILIGYFTSYDGFSKNRIVRLNTDGSIDNTFTTGSGFNNDVEDGLIQPDGKIIVTGLFTSYNGTPKNRIIRLNTNGSIDATFNIGTGADGTVYSVGLQADGKIVVGGLFYSLNGNGAGQIGRLNSDGSFDNTFTCTPGTGNIVRAIAFQADGKILLGGDFYSYNGNPVNRIVRLNTNGTFDPTFATSAGFDNAVRAITVQTDGKILVGGIFTKYKGADHYHIVRINANGSVDNSFASTPSGFTGSVFSIVTLTDGKILIAGDFNSYQGSSFARLIRINGNGTIDNSFSIGTGFLGGVVNHISIQTDGKMILSGGYSTYNGAAHPRLVRLNKDCSVATVGGPSSTPTICANTALTAITHTTTGATGIGNASGLPTGVTATWAANAITISGTPTTSGTYNYTIPLTGGCNTLDATGTITVRPSFSPGSILSLGETICSGGDPGVIGSSNPASGGDGAITYQWYSSTDDMIYLPIIGSNSTTYDPPSGLTEKTWYRRYAVDGTCNTNFNNPNNSASGVWIVKVNPVPNAPITGSTTNFSCLAGGTVQLSGLPSSGTWTINQSGTASGVKVSSGSTTTITGLAAGSYTFTVTDPIGSCTSVSSATVVISSTPNNTTGPASSSPTLCNNTVLTAITHTTTGATGIGTPTGLPAGVTASWNANTITISGTPTSSGTFNYSIPLTGGCGTVNATGTIIVNAVPTIPILSTLDQTAACSPATMTGTSSASTGNQWYKDGVLLSGEVNNTYTATASGSYTVIATENGCSSEISDPLVFTLNATPQIPVIKHVKPLITCEGNTVKLHTSSTSGNIWLLNGVPIPGETNNFYIATQSGSYTVETTNSAGCISGPSAPAVVVINPTNTVTAASSTPNLCINSALTAITHTTANATGIDTPTGLPNGVTASWNANTITISGTPTESGVFNYSILLTGGCGSITANGTITVAAENTVSIASEAPILCVNTALNPITHTTTGATGIGTPSGLPTGITAAFAGNTITLSGTPTTGGTFNYSIPITGGCGTVNATGTITVNDLNTIGIASLPTLCINTLLTPIVRFTTGATGIGAASGLPSGVNATWAADSLVISGTPTSAGVFYYSIPLTGGCGSILANGTITVNPNNTASAASSNPSLCVNSSIPTVTFTTTGATGIGTSIDLPDGVTATFGSNTITLTGTPTNSGIYSYIIPLIGGCDAVNATGTITVQPNNAASIGSDAPILCINTTLTEINHGTTIATGIGSASGLPAGVTASWTANNITISGTPTVSGTFNYSIPLTGGCGSSDATGLIIVTPENTAGVGSSTPTLCINSALTAITHTTTGATGIGTATGLPAGVTAAWAANTITISGTPTASGTFNYTIPLIGGCGLVNATGTITVSPANTVSTASSTPTICINNALTAITHNTTGATGIGTPTGLPSGVLATWAANTITISGTPSVSGTFSYSIPLTGGCGTINATGTITITPANTVSVASDSPILCINTALSPITHSTTGATGIGTPTGLPTGVTATWAANTITISGTPTSGGTFAYSIPLTGGCSLINATGTITVTPANTVSAASSSPTLCINSLLTPITHSTTGATGIGTPSGLPAGVSATWASNTITISGTPTTSGTFNYTIPLVGGCAVVTASGTIVITPANTVSAASASPTVCNNSALTAITHTTTGATGIGTATGLPAGVTAAFASNTITITGTPTVSGIYTYSIPLTGGCGSDSATGIITVYSNNTAGTASATPTLCLNTALTPFIHLTTVATGIGTATGLPPGVTATWAADTITISGTPTVAGTYNYTIPLTGGCGTANATGTITVTDLSAIQLSSAVGSNTQTICSTEPVSAITYNVTNASGANATGLPAGVTAVFNSGIVTISGSPTAVGSYNYTVTTSGGCAPDAVLTGTITVIPLSEVTLTSIPATENQVVCPNSAIANITYDLVNATGALVTGLPAGVTAAVAGGVVTISGTPTLPGTYTYTVTTLSSCTSNATTSGTITVSDISTVTLTSAPGTASQQICPNQPITAITYQVLHATGATVTGLPAGVTSNYVGGVLTISGTPTVNGVYPYTITTTGGCNAAVANGTIFVTDVATISLSSATGTDNQIVCLDSALTAITYAINGAGAATISGLPTGITGTFTSGVFTISGVSTQTGNFTYTIITVSACAQADTATGNITIIGTTPPTGNTVQIFSVAQASDATVSDLVVTGSNIIWYGNIADAQSHSNPLSASTQLISGNTYYAVNFENGCYSDTLGVLVTVYLGLETLGQDQVFIYPNPTTGAFKIDFSSMQTDITVRVFTLLGQVIDELHFSEATSIPLHLKGERGVYNIEISSQGKTINVRMVKD